MGGEFTSFDGVKLRYVMEGEGAPVVLLHGLAADTEINWRRPGIIAALKSAGRRVVGLDARGHGRSQKCYDPAAYENEAMARDVAALFDHMELESADVVGYSLGSVTALHFAILDRRLRRLVLGGIGGSRFDRATVFATWGGRIAAAMEAPDPEQIDDPLARWLRRFADSTGADLRALSALQQGIRPVPITRKELSTIEAPTLVICGDRDACPRDLAAALPDGRARVVSGDHLSAVRDPAFVGEIIRFLEGTITTPALDAAVAISPNGHARVGP